MSKNVDLEKAVTTFCSEHNVCPTKTERIFLKLAINYGLELAIEQDIKKLNKQLKKIDEKLKEF